MLSFPRIIDDSLQGAKSQFVNAIVRLEHSDLLPCLFAKRCLLLDARNVVVVGTRFFVAAYRSVPDRQRVSVTTIARLKPQAIGVGSSQVPCNIQSTRLRRCTVGAVNEEL